MFRHSNAFLNHRSLVKYLWHHLLRTLLLALGLCGVSVSTALAGGAGATAGVIIETISGLSSWLEEYDDNCAVACAGAAWGVDCSFSKDECTDTGLWSATCVAEAENSCAHGLGEALAEESVFGMWWGYTTEPRVEATAKSLHATPGDKHGASGWAKAQVDGTARAKTEETPPSRPPGVEDWPEGTVLAVAFFDSVRLVVAAGRPASCSMHAHLQVDDSISWETYVSLDGTGVLTTTGEIGGGEYLVSYDPGEDTWVATLGGMRVEIPVDTLNTALAIDSVDVDVSFDIELLAKDADAAGSPPPPIPVTPGDLRMNTPDGRPVLDGAYVHVVTPLVAIGESAPFGPFLDTNVDGGDVGFGVLDLTAAPDWQPGDLRELSGYVTHHEGRTILTSIQSSLTGTGLPVPPPAELPIAAILTNAEQLEGRRVRVVDCNPIEPSEWPEDPRQIAIVRVDDPSGAEIDLEILAPPEVLEGLLPGGPFRATGVVLQRDPEGAPFDSGYRIRLESIEESESSGVDELAVGAATKLATWPNPTTTSTEITFSLPTLDRARVDVLDASGRRVRTLAEREVTTGLQRIEWDLHDDAGKRVTAGVYFVHVASGGNHSTRKVTVLR